MPRTVPDVFTPVVYFNSLDCEVGCMVEFCRSRDLLGKSPCLGLQVPRLPSRESSQGPAPPTPRVAPGHGFDEEREVGLCVSVSSRKAL